jgi:hypothetical protein
MSLVIIDENDKSASFILNNCLIADYQFDSYTHLTTQHIIQFYNEVKCGNRIISTYIGKIEYDPDLDDLEIIKLE